MSLKTIYYNQQPETSSLEINKNEIVDSYLKNTTNNIKMSNSNDNSENMKPSSSKIEIKKLNEQNSIVQTKPPLPVNKDTQKKDLDTYIHINDMIDRFRYTKPTPKEERTKIDSLWWNKDSIDENELNGKKTPPDIDIENSSSYDEYLKTENEEIENLCKKLKDLRKKLLNKSVELSKSIDLNELDDSTSDVTLSVDNSSSSGSTVDEKITKRLSNNREPLKPKISNNKPISLSAKTLNNSKKKDNIDSLEFKTQNLIEKSDSTLDRMVSSSNITSSQASTISSMRSSSDSQPPFKPEFAKYIENKTNPIYSKETGEPLKPEDDILYQWRLRRKMEELKAEETKNQGFASLPIITTTKSPTATTSAVQKKIEPTVITKQRETKEIETQTRRTADTAIQTSLDSIVFTSTSSSLTDKLNLHKNEIPTRDEENKTSNQVNKIKKTKTTKLVASSPIKSSQNKHKQISNQNINLTPNISNNNSIDLTKVSSINEMTYISNANQQPPPKRSNSPVNISSKKSEIKQQYKSSKNHPITTLSSIESTITNVTSHFPQNTLTSSTNSLNNIQNHIDEINNVKFNKTVTINDSFNTNKSLDRLNKNISQSDLYDEDLTDYYPNKYDLLICNDALREFEQDKEYYESDEILQILFKKIYFYKSKLKEIDDLLTK